jgi:sugar (pentulose or hexulose) kinase
MNTFLSIDVGTSSTKLSLFSETGRLLSAKSAAYTIDYPHTDWAEQDAQQWWRAVCQLAPAVLAPEDAAALRGISVSGQAPLCVPLDRQGRPLRKAILWHDRRATAQVSWLRDHIGEETCRAISTNRLDSYFGGVKWLWYRQEEAALFAQTWKILQASSYVIYQLCGQAVIDPSQAGLCSPCFNFSTRDWDPGICASMGIPLAMLPAVHPSQALVGSVTAQAARESGIPAGVPIVCGGGDFACSCLSTGIAGKNQAALMLGTAGNLLFPGAANRDPRLLHTIHLTGDALPFGGVLAGTNLSWFASLLGDASPDLLARLDAEAASVPAGSEGLVYLPYLLGERTPIWDPAARGAFIGLSARHTRAHLYRAILEGVAFAFHQIAKIAAMPVSAIVAIDGGARSPLWRAILASVIGIPVIGGGERSGTALGSAFLAARGPGTAASFSEMAAWTETLAQTDPDAHDQQVYQQIFPLFAGLYPKLSPEFHQLAR